MAAPDVRAPPSWSLSFRGQSHRGLDPPLPRGEIGAKRRVRGCGLTWVPEPLTRIACAIRPLPSGEVRFSIAATPGPVSQLAWRAAARPSRQPERLPEQLAVQFAELARVVREGLAGLSREFSLGLHGLVQRTGGRELFGK